MNKRKYLILIIPLLFLSSCWLSDIEPDFDKPTWTTLESWKIDKLEAIKNWKELYLNEEIDYKNNLAIKEEINDRQKWYNEINDNKEYLSKIALNLQNKIVIFTEYIEVTRKLIVVDLKIVNAIQQWFLDEKSINKNNYFYAYLRKQDKNKRATILKNMDNLITIVGDKKTFDKYYYSNLDLSKVEELNNNTSIIYEYTNYYLKNVKYSVDIQTNINLILKLFNVLKIEKIITSETSGGFLKSKTKKYLYKNTLKNLQKKILK